MLFAKTRLLLLMSGSVLALSSCTGDEGDDEVHANAHVSQNKIYLIDANRDGVLDATQGPLQEVPNTNVRVVRYEDSVSVRADVAGWMAGDVLTIWWVFFNNPENCKAA